MNPADLTESDIHAWHVAELAKLNQSGAKGMEVHGSSDPTYRFCCAGWAGDNWKSGHGRTILEAYTDFRKSVPTGAERATKLRADRAKIDAELAVLEGAT